MSGQPPPGGPHPRGHRPRPGQEGPPPGYAQQLGQHGSPAGHAQQRFEQLERGHGSSAGGGSGAVMNRMLLLIGGALALAVIALVVLLRIFYAGSGPERVAEDWFEAVADQDCGTVERLSTDDLLEGLAPLCSEDDLLDQDVALEITGSTVTEERDDTATVELTLRFRVAGEPPDSAEEDSTVELVKQDGDWKVSSAS